MVGLNEDDFADEQVQDILEMPNEIKKGLGEDSDDEEDEDGDSSEEEDSDDLDVAENEGEESDREISNAEGKNKS